jgi:hypothetical protein
VPASAAPEPDLRIVQTQVFRGPNYWSYESCIRMLVDLGSLEEWPSNRIPGFNEGLLELLPGVAQHSCSVGRRGGFGERLVDGTWLGHVAEHVALELQRETGAHISRGKTRSAGETGRYNVIYGYWEESVGLEAGHLAVRLVNHLVGAEDGFDFLAELERLIRLAERRAFGPSTQSIIDEAASRDIPWMRLNEASLIQLGQGRYQQRIRATMTSLTSALAVDIASDKKMTNQLLAAAGLPVPRSEVVRTADEAVTSAERIGYPVVLKAVSAELTHKSDVGAVALDLATPEQLTAAYDRMTRDLRAHTLAGMLVCRQIRGGLELALGLHRDPEMGLVVMAGSGGVLLELVKDVAFCALPVSPDKARDMLASLRGAKLLQGYRGAPARDVEAAVDALVALGQLAMDLEDVIESVDINPFVALPKDAKGGGMALDALIVLRKR